MGDDPRQARHAGEDDLQVSGSGPPDSAELDRRAIGDLLYAALDVVRVLERVFQHQMALADAHLVARAQERHGTGACAMLHHVSGDDYPVDLPCGVGGGCR